MKNCISFIESEFEEFKRIDTAQMREVTQEDIEHFKSDGYIIENGTKVSISEADLKNKSPKIGDMIARNPKNHKDVWLVAKKYAEENFEKLNESELDNAKKEIPSLEKLKDHSRQKREAVNNWKKHTAKIIMNLIGYDENSPSTYKKLEELKSKESHPMVIDVINKMMNTLRHSIRIQNS